jgi:hypothetical protein
MVINRIAAVPLVLFSLMLAPALGAAGQAAPQQSKDKVKTLIDQAIQALGGDAYLGVKDYSAIGRYYVIEEDRQGWTEFVDQMRYPSKSHQETGKKGDKETTIFDLEAGKGWTLFGDFEVRPATPEQLERFRKSNNHNLDYILRFRRQEKGVTLHYYGSDFIEGRKAVEIIELIDAENDSVRIAFDESSGLPFRTEFQEIGKYGRKLRIAEELSNWHIIQGVNTPMKTDRFTNDQPSAQIFITKIAYNVGLADSLFVEPTINPKNAKKKKL